MSIPTGALARALRDLDKSMRNSLDGTKIEQIKDAIGNYAIAAAVASGVAGVAPGIAGVAAALPKQVLFGPPMSKSIKHWIYLCRKTRQSLLALPL